MMLTVKFLLFILCLTGYVLFLTQKYQIKIEFAPALLCAWAGSLLFAGGILNILPYAAWVIFGGGYVLLALSFRRRLIFPKRDLLLYAAFVLVLFYFYVLLSGAHYTSYDNFSHWATVVKDLLRTERMPNFEDAVIRFQSYPLGSSLFIYSVCRVIGTSDGCLLWAQFFMMLSFLFCFSAFVRKRNWPWMLLLFLYGIWTLTANNSIYELRVDTLLPAAAAAAFAMIYEYREKPRLAVFCSSGMFILLIQIKNSGVFFYAVCAAALAVYAGSFIRQHKMYFINAALVLPLLSMFLWKRHVALVFPEGMSTKHAMSLENYGQMLAKKSGADMLQIGVKMARRFLSLENVEVRMLLFTTLLALFLFLLGQPLGRVCRVLALNWGLLALYTISVYGMYVFSMPMGEASNLASYDRYMISVLIFIYGITVVYLMDAAGPGAEKGRKICTAAVLLFAALPLWQSTEQLSGLFQNPDYAQTSRCRFQKMVRRDGLETGKSYMIYCNGTDDFARYLFYLSRYEFWSGDVTVLQPEDLENTEQTAGQVDGQTADYDYLIVWDSDEKIDQYLAEHQLAQYQGMEQLGIDLR